MELSQSDISKKILNALVETGNYSKDVSKEISFHMTDWLEDLEKLNETFSNIEKLSPDDIEKGLMEFLIHAPNHINAAVKLMTGEPVEDVFEIGAVKKS